MRKPEPHELAGAKSWVRSINGPPWDKLTPELQRGAIAKARRILRAAGRGGQPKAICKVHAAMCEVCKLNNVCGPARMRRGRK